MKKIRIEGMTCGHCVASVTKALQQVPGVDRVDINLDLGEAKVDGNPALNALIAAVQNEGFQAKEIL
jgi:copper chaperone